MSYPPIEDHAVIGDRHTVALVALDGSIDFLCYPHFDSPSVFARLLDDERGGAFQLCPALPDARRQQLYLPGTNVLLTRFLSEQGVGEISDFMTVDQAPGGAHRVVRRAKTVRGTVTFRVTCDPSFDYGRSSHRLVLDDQGAVFVPETDEVPPMRLRTPAPLEGRDGAAVAEFELGAGETMPFVLERAAGDGSSPSAEPGFVSEAFKATVNRWREWIGRSRYDGRWQSTVHRSALTLKLLTSAPHGSLVAAPTFGLPEEVGGERNWDYRYTWIRDASFTLWALMRLGYREEADDFVGWLGDRCIGCDTGAESGPLQIMYGLDGREELEESVLEHFEGYRGSSPVRVGNGAYDQLQLDIYGELLDALNLYDEHREALEHDLWTEVVRLADWVTENWERSDEGIWEVRGGRRDFLYSRLMCWVALDRAVRIARRRSFPGPVDRWTAERDRIYRAIYEGFWDEGKGAFVQHRETSALDASSLMMPLVGFVGPTDPRWLSHLDAVQEELVSDSLVYRYRPSAGTEDGLAGEEGTFTICTFWYVECLARAGRVRQARLLFEKALGYANHVGLYAEELGARGEHLGNFPQAFTHLALIRAACELDHRLAQQRIA